MSNVEVLTDKINLVAGTITALLSYVLGEHWFLFVAFLGLNLIDYITGCLKSRINGKTNSKKGAIGALKKVGYWLMILVSFGMSAIFIEIGETMNVNLQITSLLGWFVLATLIINEFRSIIENFVEAGYKVPAILTKGLEIANKKIEDLTDLDDDDDQKEE